MHVSPEMAEDYSPGPSRDRTSILAFPWVVMSISVPGASSSTHPSSISATVDERPRSASWRLRTLLEPFTTSSARKWSGPELLPSHKRILKKELEMMCDGSHPGRASDATTQPVIMLTPSSHAFLRQSIAPPGSHAREIASPDCGFFQVPHTPLEPYPPYRFQMFHTYRWDRRGLSLGD